MRIVPVILIAIAVLTVPLIWLAVRAVLPPGSSLIDGPSVDSGARIEIEVLRQQIEALKEQLDALTKEVDTLSSRAANRPSGPGRQSDDPVLNLGPNAIIDAYAQVVLIANRRNVNRNFKVATPSFLEEFLGRPREVLGDNCEPMTNEKLKALLRVENVGPIQVQMLQPAIDSLRRVFENVRAADPDLYARINTAGSLCVRQIRGSIGRTSTHSFGLAVDLNIDGSLDTLGDGRTQLGLTILADFFRDEGWVWGAGFTREDSMHFEVSRQMLEEWRAANII